MPAVLAVCAHPDDESFGLGAILAALSDAGTLSCLVCFTHGEASDLGVDVIDLGQRRAEELAAAAAVLGVTRAELLDYPDGQLGEIPVTRLADEVHCQARLGDAGTLLVFDEGGITGHPDHRRATQAAMLAAERDNLTVLAWTIPNRIAKILNAEFAATFLGRAADEIDLSIAVNRETQLDAIGCHTSQSSDNPVLWRRLELLGDVEHLRYLRVPT